MRCRGTGRSKRPPRRSPLPKAGRAADDGRAGAGHSLHSGSTETVTQNGQQKTRTVRVTKELYLSPETNSIKTDLKPERKKKSIYESVLFVAANSGFGMFCLPGGFCALWH